MSRVIPRVVGFPMAPATKLRGNDPAIVERLLDNLVDPRRIRFCAGQRRPDIRVSHVPLGSSHLFGVQHGASIHVSSAPISSWQVMVPLAGKISGRSGSDAIVALPGEALLYAPQSHFDTTWSDGCISLVLSVPAASMAKTAQTIFAGARRDPTRARPSLLALDGSSGRSFANALSVICEEAGDPSSAFCRGFTTASLEETLLVSLLLAQGEERASGQPAAPCRKSAVDRAVDYIALHLEKDLTIADLAAAAGVSARSLQYGFVERFGFGPMSYLKETRLHRIRATLQDAALDGQASVGDIAAHFGFYNGSNFARLYRQTFGELPSQTLRQS